MLKLILILFFSLSLHAEVGVRWVGVTSLVVDDGATRIMFDPMFTRATAFHWLGLRKFRSNEILVKKTLDHFKLKVDALFVSHSHFDHSIDAPIVAKLTGATLYTDQGMERIAKAYKDPSIKMVRIKEYQKIKIGNFIVTPIKREHEKILGLWDFLPGEVPADFDFGFYQYRLGELWFYLIEHPEGRILLDESSSPAWSKIPKEMTVADVVIQGIANRKDDDAILKGYIGKLSPQFFIPIHFDNFFLDFDRANITLMPGMGKESLLKKMNKMSPSLQIIDPEMGKRYTILKAK